MKKIFSRMYSCAQAGRHQVKTDLAIRCSSYHQTLQERLDHYTEPGDAESLRLAGTRFSLRKRIHSYTA